MKIQVNEGKQKVIKRHYVNISHSELVCAPSQTQLGLKEPLTS